MKKSILFISIWCIAKELISSLTLLYNKFNVSLVLLYSKFDTNRKKSVFIITFSIVCLFIANIYSLYLFPPTEGWWQTYGYLYNKGLVLYKDINLAYTPLFVLFNAMVLKFTNLFIVFRLIGFCFTIITFIFLYFSLIALGYRRSISAFSSMVAILFSMVNVVYLVYDYPILLNLFVMISIYFFILSYKQINLKRSEFFNPILVAFFSCLALITKQNVGMLFLLAYLISYLYLFFVIRNKNSFLILVLYALSFTSFSIILMKLVGVDFNTFLQLTIQNDSKGDVGTLFLRIFNENNLTILLIALIPICIYSVLFKLSHTIRRYGEELLVFICIFFLLIYLLFFNHGMDKGATVVSILYTYCLFILLLNKKDNGILFFCMMLQIVAISTTSDISIAGVYFIFAFALAYFLNGLNRVFNSIIYSFILLLVSCGITYSITNIKFQNPYSWWGLNQSSIKDAKYSLPFHEMRYIKVDKATYGFFSDVKKYADIYKFKQMYFYPHIPVFYELYKTQPPTKNIVEWFDVINTTNLSEELYELAKNPPQLAVVLDPPFVAYIGHSELKHSKLLQPFVINYFDDGVRDGCYKLVDFNIFDNSLSAPPLSDSSLSDLPPEVTLTLIAKNPNIIGKTINEVFPRNMQLNSHLKIISYNDYSYSPDNMSNQTKIQPDDKIVLTVRYSYLSYVVTQIGAPNIEDQKFYSYRIYVKIDNVHSNLRCKTQCSIPRNWIN